jgi:hypothetical protein
MSVYVRRKAVSRGKEGDVSKRVREVLCRGSKDMSTRGAVYSCSFADEFGE